VFRAALARADLVVCTGGLGPTDDDVTREVVAATLGRELKEDADITERMRARFIARGYQGPMPESNRRQAMVPSGARVIENSPWQRAWTVARGRRIDRPSTAWTATRTQADVHRVGRGAAARTCRRGPARSPRGEDRRRIESQTDEVLQPLYREWAEATPPITATILAALGQIELHLATQAASTEIALAALDAAIRQVTAVIGADVFSTDGRSMEAVVGDMLASADTASRLLSRAQEVC
jgi:nicotinamide-nucleotide amidase